MTTTALPPSGAPRGPGPRVDLSGDPRRQRKERLMGTVFGVAAGVSLLISALILYSLFTKGWGFFADVRWSTVFGSDLWAPRSGEFSITTLLVGSIVVTGVALVVAAPLGLGAAIYLAEYARPRVRRVLKPILEVLAGVPSVVLGFFALRWIAPNVVGRLFGEEAGRGGSMLAAGIGVGILTVPLVASVSEDAMRSVPDALRQASAGLGARKMTTSLKVVVPAAVSGIVAALILATSRAIGETMVVYIAGGAADQAQFVADPRESTLTMTAAMASLASGSDQVTGDSLAVGSLYFLGIILFVFTLGLNVLGNRFVRKFRQAY